MLSCSVSVCCYGQAPVLEAGFSAPIFLKVNTTPDPKAKSSVLGATGIDFVLQVNGADENTMSFVQTIGITDDKRSFRTEPGSEIRTGLYFLNINPSVLIRSKWDNIKYSIGIGALVNIGQAVETSTSTNSTGTFYSSVDSATKQVADNSRGVIPFISLGVTWNIRKHLRAQLLVEPTLINFYEPDAKITYNINYVVKDIPLSYQPVYFGVRVFYFF